MYVSLSTRISKKTTRRDLTKFSVHVTYGRGSVLLWQHCSTLCTSSFMDDVMFTRSGLHGMWLEDVLDMVLDRPVERDTCASRGVMYIESLALATLGSCWALITWLGCELLRLACLSVCMSLCWLAYLKNNTARPHKIFCTCYLWPWLNPPLMTLQYVMYFHFCGCHMFACSLAIWHVAREHSQSDSPEWVR